jgi:hypothetical protein
VRLDPATAERFGGTVHAAAMLRAQKRTRANESELLRRTSSYPLSLKQNVRLSRLSTAGNLVGKFASPLRKLLNLLP